MGNNQIKQKYIKEIKNGIEYDRYKLFNIPKDFTWNQLKESYKKLAIQAHPDKGGDKIIFDYLTKTFKELSHEYKLRTSNKNFNELKNDYKLYNEKVNENKEVRYNDRFSDGLSFNERLNKHFNEFKMEDEDVDFGYGDKMVESTSDRDDIKIDNIFNNRKVNNETFNNTFNKTIKKVNNEIIKYEDPTPMILSKNLSYTEIGKGKNNDYSSGVEKTNNLAYTDYLKAHTTNRLVNHTDFENIKKFKNTEEYKKYSDKKIKKTFTEKELKHIDKKKNKEEKDELERLERIKQYNILMEKKYESANRFFLK